MSKSDGMRSLTLQAHEERVLKLLRVNGAMSRAELARALDLSRTTLSGLTASLLEQGAIVVTTTDADEREGSGRPAERLALDPGAGQYIALEFSHVRVCVVIADAAHEIIGRARGPYAAGAGWDERLAVAFDIIDGLIAAGTDVHLNALRAVAVGVPGPVSALGLDLREGWGRLPSGATVRDVFERRFGVPVIVDNNTRFAAIAEANSSEGAGRDIIFARLSEGIGGGVIIAGRLVTGSRGLAGEIGHLRAVVEGGRPCRCGKNGCLETVASVPAILHGCQERGVPVHDLAGLAAAVEREDPTVLAVLDGAGAAVGAGLAGLAVVLNPEEIIIGGEILQVAPRLLDAAAAALGREVLPVVEVCPTVVAARGGDESGAIGGILALLHRSPLLAGYQEPTVDGRTPRRADAS